MPLRLLPLLAGLVLLPALAAAQSLAGVDVKGLDPDERAALVALMAEGACPCDPKQSLLQCIEARTCERATELASFGAGKFREGLGVDQVREAVVRKYVEEHVTYTFDLSASPKKGAASGRITIVEFADFECPHCAHVARFLPEVLAAHPADVTLYFKFFPLRLHATSGAAARAAWAAGRQGRFWPMHDLIFANQARLDDELLVGFAQELGLNLEKFQADMASQAATDALLRDRDEGEKALLRATPTLYINGKAYDGDKTPEALKAHIAGLLKAQAAAPAAKAPGKK